MELAAPERKPMLGYQHPLSVYDDLIYGTRGADLPEVAA